MFFDKKNSVKKRQDSQDPRMTSRTSNVTVVSNVPSKICVFYTGSSIDDLSEIVFELTGSPIHLAKYMVRKLETSGDDEQAEFETYGVLATISEHQFKILEKAGYAVGDRANEFSVAPYEYLDETGDDFKAHLVPDPKENQSWSINIAVPSKMSHSEANQSIFAFTRELVECKIVKSRPEVHFPGNCVENTHKGYIYLNPKAETSHEEIVKMMVLLKGRQWNDESKFNVRARWALNRGGGIVLNPETDTSLHKPVPVQTKSRKIRASRSEKIEEVEERKTPSEERKTPSEELVLTLENSQSEVDTDGFKTVKPKTRGKRAEALKAAEMEVQPQETADL